MNAFKPLSIEFVSHLPYFYFYWPIWFARPLRYLDRASLTPDAGWDRWFDLLHDRSKPMGAVPHNACRESARFTSSLRIRCPSSLPAAVDAAAAQNLMTASQYIRESIIAQLKVDSIDLAAELRRSGMLPAGVDG